MIKAFIIFTSFLIALGCGTSSAVQSGEKKTGLEAQELAGDNLQGSPEQRLARILQRASGVVVTERGGQYAVTIRGGYNSFDGNVQPLFVVNGQPIGRDFNSAAQAIMGQEISSVRVLKDSDASLYGVRGASGVIEIKAK